MPHPIRATSRAQTALVASAIGALTLTGLLLPAGCIATGGNTQHIQPTLGRQLVDLKQARDSGAIDEEQYQCKKKELLARN